eukprot:tig00000241_g20926.t1
MSSCSGFGHTQLGKRKQDEYESGDQLEGQIPAKSSRGLDGNDVDTTPNFELLPDEILLAIYRDVLRTDGPLGLVLSLGGTSRRLRDLCWYAEFFEEVELEPAHMISVSLLESCFRRMGNHVRKLCLSGLYMRGFTLSSSSISIGELLSLTPGLTHLSLAHMRFLKEEDEDGVASVQPIVLQNLPPLPSLHTLNLSDIVVFSDVLRTVVSDASDTLQRLFLWRVIPLSPLPSAPPPPPPDPPPGASSSPPPSRPPPPPPSSPLPPSLPPPPPPRHTPFPLPVNPSPAPPHLPFTPFNPTLTPPCRLKNVDNDHEFTLYPTTVLQSLADLWLPQLRALDLSHSVVEAEALVDWVNAHPSLEQLYLRQLKKKFVYVNDDDWSSLHASLSWFAQLDTWTDGKYASAIVRFGRSEGLAICGVDGELYDRMEEGFFEGRPLEPGELDEFVAEFSDLPGDACWGLEARDHRGRTPFLAAVARGDLDLARRLKEAGADVSAICHPHPRASASRAKRWSSPFPFFPSEHSWHCSDEEGEGATALHLLEDLGKDPRDLAEGLRALGLAPLANARARRRGMETPLHAHAAADGGSVQIVSTLLALGSDPFLKNASGDNALFAALRGPDCKAEVVKALLDAHPSLADALDTHGESALFAALRGSVCKAEVLGALLGARPSLARTTDAQGRSPIAMLAHSEWSSALAGKVAALTAAGAIEWGEDAARLLRVAVLENSEEVVRRLLALPGADPGAALASWTDAGVRRPGGVTPLMEAMTDWRDGCTWRALLAVPDIDVDARDDAGRTVLHHVAVDDGYYGCRDGPSQLEALLEHPVDLNAVDGKGFTALHLLLLASGSLLPPQSRAKIQKLLERRELDPNMRDPAGLPPLFLAVRRKAHDVLQLLLDRPDLDVNATAEGGKTALWLACAEHDWWSARRILRFPGVDVHRAPAGRPSPIFLAISAPFAREAGDPERALHFDVLEVLFARGARAEPADDSGYGVLHHVVANSNEAATADALLFLDDPRAACALRDPQGRTPFLAACQAGHFASARALLPHSDAAAQDAEWNGALHVSESMAGGGLPFLHALLKACPEAALARNLAGQTPLHLHARRHPWVSVVRLAPEEPERTAGGGEEEAEREVAEAAASFVAFSDLLATDAAGRTPLHVAAAEGEAGPLLLAMLHDPQAAAALCAQDRAGSTPLHLACRNGSLEVARALVEGARRTGAAGALELRDLWGLRPVDAAPAALRPLFDE